MNQILAPSSFVSEVAALYEDVRQMHAANFNLQASSIAVVRSYLGRPCYMEDCHSPSKVLHPA